MNRKVDQCESQKTTSQTPVISMTTRLITTFLYFCRGYSKISTNLIAEVQLKCTLLPKLCHFNITQGTEACGLLHYHAIMHYHATYHAIPNL